MTDYKLCFVQELMEQHLLEIKSGTRKLKPIINVRSFSDAKGVNNTAFYFKTEKDYYFVSLKEDKVHLGVKKVPASTHTNDSYRHYLVFGPRYLNQCPSCLEEVDGGSDRDPAVQKSTIPTSPLDLVGSGDEKGGHVPLFSPNSNGSSPCEKPGFDGPAAADSGLESGSKCSDDSGDDSTLTGLHARPQVKTM